VLRKGNTTNKQAILYEVVTENTSEERTSERRHGESYNPPQHRQLKLISDKPKPIKKQFKAAEESRPWSEEE
jgi:superfamily II DNA or RNA helicase